MANRFESSRRCNGRVTYYRILRTATRLRNLAQGWSTATTLGSAQKIDRRNPDGVVSDSGRITQRSRSAATLGFVTQPLRGCLIMAVFMLFTQVAVAQRASILTGRVTDERNANVFGAEVRLISRTGGIATTTSDGNGRFEFKNISAGDYLLEIKASGFSSTAMPLTVALGQAVTKDVALSIEAVSETVVVTPAGTAQRVDEAAKAITVLENQEIESKREIALTESLRGVPGVRVQQQGSPGALTSVRLRGQRPFDTAVLLDGLRVRDAGDINGSAVPLFADLVPSDLDRVEVLRGSGS